MYLLDFACVDENFGAGDDGDEAIGDCDEDEVGSVTATCNGTTWNKMDNSCVLRAIKELEDESQVRCLCLSYNLITACTGSCFITGYKNCR